VSIRALARDLYRAQNNLDLLQKIYDQADTADKIATGLELKAARAELDMLRRMLEGEKESADIRKRFSGFGSSKK
jgi:hypothetical protein